MECSFEKSSVEQLIKYIDLYKICFPLAKHLHMEYLQWLYADNPEGKFLGVDAVYDDKVVGQVLAIPTCFQLDGKITKGLVAVNVVVHPAFQGRHLFKKLGLKMCERGANEGYSFVIGVSNAAATLGWTRQMGFQLVKPLDAVIGFGSLGIHNFSNKLENCAFKHSWTQTTLQWRCNNPVNPVKKFGWGESRGMIASAGKAGISAYAELFVDDQIVTNVKKASLVSSISPRVFIGLIPSHKYKANYFDIPNKFRASPLNFIYKNLVDSSNKLDPNTCFINFLDFDAF